MILINNKDFDKLEFCDIDKFLRDYDNTEGFFVELKNNHVSNNDLLKEICAFCNTFGGYIILGVEDDKTITGCLDWSEEKISNIIRNGLSPLAIFEVRNLTKNNITIYVIKIEEGPMPPYVTNSGKIYERISSSSFPLNSSSSINRLVQKRNDNIKNIENKIYIPPISDSMLINNLCGYVDFGFSVNFKDANKSYEIIQNINYEKISNILKKDKVNFSISKVGYSVCITYGDTVIDGNGLKYLTPAGITNFMEILPDGSFRCRVVLSADGKSIVSINPIILIPTLFKDVYMSIFKDKFSENFIQAICYQKLTVLKVFKPKYMTSINSEEYDIFENYFNNHIIKYGSNIVANSNRIPINGFYTIDKSLIESEGLEYNDQNIIDRLFRCNYINIGGIDEFNVGEMS